MYFLFTIQQSRTFRRFRLANFLFQSFEDLVNRYFDHQSLGIRLLLFATSMGVSNYEKDRSGDLADVCHRPSPVLTLPICFHAPEMIRTSGLLIAETSKN